MQIRVLSAADLRAAIDMPAAIEAMRDAFIALASGEVTVPLRLGLETPHGVTLFMPAYSSRDGSAAAKVVSVSPGNAARGLPAIHAVVMALDAETGRVRALMDGTWLTALRTGAVGGLAADLLARPDARVVALFGAGPQARTQLEAVRAVRDVREVRVTSRSGRSADALVAELRDVEARRVDDPAAAVRGADVVIAATSSATPVFPGDAVAAGTHVTGVGSYTTAMREVDADLVRRARVFVEHRETAMAEAGDIVGAIRDGAVDESVIAAELGDVLLGRAGGRTSAVEITFFKSVGNAVEDLVVATRALERAETAGLGVVVDL